MQAGHLWFTASLPLLTRFPLVLTVHDPSRHLGDQGAQKTPQWLIDLGTYRAAQVIVHAPQLKEELVGRLRLRSDHVHVVSTVLRGDDSAAPGVGERDGTILFFGRIWPYKGLDYLIRAEPLITKEIPHARIVIAGEGEDFDRYRRMMLHPEKFVVYNHYIPDQRRAELFREASVVALPYVEASQSGVIPIAYRLGKPVVATAVGGLPELVEDGRTGFLVPPRDERQLANAIVRLLRDSSLRHKFGAVGKQKIETQCSPDAVALKTFKIYQEVLKAPRNTHVRHASSSSAS
jgi:glycosyltransferase involved in cell wall biosynthesis